MSKFCQTQSNEGKRRVWGLGVAFLGAALAATVVLPAPVTAWHELGDVATASARDSRATNQAALAGASLALWILLGWLAIGTALLLIAELPGHCGAVARALSRLLLPRLFRQLACGLLSVSLAGGVWTGTARAAVHSEIPLSATSNIRHVAQEFDWPTAPAGSAPVRPRTEAPESPTHASSVVVAPGDCLWSITERSLGKGASGAAVAYEWPRWWKHNRDVIGDNPHLIHPGQKLQSPPRR